MDYQKKLGWTISVAFYEGHLKGFSCFSILFFWVVLDKCPSESEIMSTLTSKQDCASLWELWVNRKRDLTVSHYVMMVFLICLSFGCGYWADLWRDCSQIRESCQCIWHSWLFVSSRSLLTQRTQDDQYILFVSHWTWFPRNPPHFHYLFLWGFFYHRQSLLWLWLGPCQLQKLQHLWNLKLYVIFYPLSSFPQEPPQQGICLSANRLGSPKSRPWPGHSSCLHANTWLEATIISCLCLVYTGYWSPYFCPYFSRVYFLQ